MMNRCLLPDGRRVGCRYVACSLSLTLFLCSGLLGIEARADEEFYFESHVRPILKAHCFHCHGDEEKHAGNLDLRTVRAMLAGGEAGPGLVRENPSDSFILERISAQEMPPGKKKLSATEQEIIRAWIAQGARTRREEPADVDSVSPWTFEERTFWAFQPVQRPSVPKVSHPDLVRTPVDAFLLAKLETEGLSFSPEAARHTLIRRLSLDLLGLPPDPERVAAFIQDASPMAYVQLVDEYLASPAYGERWGRHWLDTAGYADSDGYNDDDSERTWAFRYRDYVIRALNDDMPWNQFIVEQLAGDELVTPPYTNLHAADANRLAATGFLRMAPDGTARGGAEATVARNDVVAETIKIVSTSLLGLSVGCAQCHNHRYDPISQLDYYRFRAIFEPAFDTLNWRAPPARLVNLWSIADQELATHVEAELRKLEVERVAELQQIVGEIFQRELAKLPADQQGAAQEARDTPADRRTVAQVQILKDHPSLNVDGHSAYLYEPQRLQQFKQKYEEQQGAKQSRRPAESYVACLTEVPGTIPATHLFYRGDVQQPRQEVLPGDLSIFEERAAVIPVDDPQLPTSGRRLALARHLVSGEHPLVARVLVNRIWMHHFGHGIVATPADFGMSGASPTHPELLDWLADEFIDSGWSVKSLHRQMVLSTAYQQSSRSTDALNAQDPENRWLGRMSVRRLEAEAIRDSLLEVGGLREGAMYGPAVTVGTDEVGQVVIGKAARDGNAIAVAQADNSSAPFRRSIYIQARRSMPLSLLEPFDLAGTTPNCDLRPSSTVAPQSLLMMNSEVIQYFAQQFAQRLLREAGAEPQQQIRRAWLLTYAAEPTAAEIDRAVKFLKDVTAEFDRQKHPQLDAATPANAHAALALFCQALLSSNRFLYVD